MSQFSIVNANSDKALDIHGGLSNGVQEPGTDAVQWTIDGGKTQLWRFVSPGEAAGPSGYLLKNEYGLALGPAANQPWVSGQTPDPAAVNQQWSIMSPPGVSEVFFQIVNLGNNEVLDVPDAPQDRQTALESGAQIQLYDSNAHPNQLWSLQIVNGGPEQPSLTWELGVSPPTGGYSIELTGSGFVGVSGIFIYLLGVPTYNGTPQPLSAPANTPVLATPVNNGNFQYNFTAGQTVGEGVTPNNGKVTIVAQSADGIIQAVTTITNQYWYG
jgi:hypothetical protein